MRTMKRRALGLSLLAGTALIWSGCEGKKATEYVAGISTQVQVPKDLKTIRVDVNVGGVPVFCRAYKVYEGRVQLPRSLGSYPSEGARLGEPITVSVVGYTKDILDPDIDAELQCLSPVKPGTTARILRRSRQPYVKDSILFLPMALRFSCFDKDCETTGQDKTCKAGRCVDALNTDKLPIFDEDLLDGTGSNCFDASGCFAAAAPAVVVDPKDCTYALPNTPSAPSVLEGLPPNPFPKSGDGVNVAIVYDGGYGKEVLDKDDAEGFLVPDPNKPQQFRLAPGLCDMVRGVDPDGNDTPHRITGVFASGTCQAKGKYQPLCKDDMMLAMGLDPEGITPNQPAEECKPVGLKPPTSSLLLLADNTANSQNFFDDVGGAAVSLADPAFEKTQLGLMFYPGTGSCGGSPRTFTADVPFELARNAQSKVISAFTTAFAALRPLGTPNDLDGALKDAYALLQARPNDYRRAVLLLGNRSFDQTTCGGSSPSALAAAAFAAPTSTKTFVVMLTGNTDAAAPDPVPSANVLAQAGGTAGVYDARLKSQQAEANRAFRDVVNELATCVYDAPAGAVPADAILSYSDPVANRTYTIAPDAACTGASAGGNGWGRDGTGRIFVCGQACTDYRNVLQTASAYNLQYLKPALAVPMFAHKSACKP
jgi:hypothetical protein